MGLDALLEAFLSVLNGGSILYLMTGVLLGLTFGVIPGLGGTTALALLIPVTYTLDPLNAMYLAGGVMGANLPFGPARSRDSCSKTRRARREAERPRRRFRTAYRLARQGRPVRPLGAAATASPLGGSSVSSPSCSSIPVDPRRSSELSLVGILPAHHPRLAVPIASVGEGKLSRGPRRACLGLLSRLHRREPGSHMPGSIPRHQTISGRIPSSALTGTLSRNQPISSCLKALAFADKEAGKPVNH